MPDDIEHILKFNSCHTHDNNLYRYFSFNNVVVLL